MGTMFLNHLINCPKPAWQLRIPDLIRAEVREAQAHTVFHFESANVVQELSPALEVFEVLSHTMRETDVTDLPTIRSPPGDVDGGSGQACSLVHVSHTNDRPTVNAYSHSQAHIVLQ